MKRSISFILALAVFAAFWTSSGTTGCAMGMAGEKMEPARCQAGDYSIQIPADCSECVKYSAETLKRYFDASCGTDIPIESCGVASARPQSRVIEFREDACGEYALGDEGYHVTVSEECDVTLTCGAKRGSLYAAFYFLEKFMGYRFLTDDVVYLYEKGRLDIVPGFKDTEVPGFVYRALNEVGTTVNDFAPLRLNAVDGEGSRATTAPKYGGGVGNLYLHAHSYAYQEAVGMKLDEAGITDMDSEEAMEVFRAYGYNTAARDALHLDSRQPCLTSEDTFRHIMNFNRLLYKERTERGQAVVGRDYTMFSVSPNDNTAFCTCDRCKAVYNEEGSIAGAVFRLSNRVAAAMKEEMPGIGVFTIAYWDARNPPARTKPDRDVCVAFCVGGCNNHTYDRLGECKAAGGNDRYPFLVWDTACQAPAKPEFALSNIYDMDCFGRWCELTDNICFWYYATNFNYFISPSPNIFNIYDDFRYVAEHGVRGMYCEGSSKGFTFENLRGYLAAKMMWNPFMEKEEFEGHMDEFLMIYYGPGWRSIREYIDLQNRAGDLKGCWTNNFDWPWDIYDKAFFAQNFDHMAELFGAARDATGDPVQKERVEKTSIHAYFLGLSATYERDAVCGDEAAKRRYKERYAYLWNYLNEKGYLKGVREDGYKCTDFQSGPGGLDNFPRSPADVRDPMTWIFADFTGTRLE